MTTQPDNSKAREVQAAAMARIKRPTVSEIATAMINGIGIDVGWKFSSAQQTPEQLRQRVIRAGLQADTVPDIDPVAGIKRAVSEWRVKDGRTTIAKAEIVAVDTDTKEVAVGILYHTRKGDREVAKLQREILVWSTATDEWTQPGTSDEANSLRRRVAMRMSYYDGNDVRDRLIMPGLRAAMAVSSLRGSYYVPTAHLDTLEALEAALDGLDGFSLELQGVEAGQGGDARMASSAVQHVGDELAKLEDQIEGWIDQASAPGSNTEEHMMGRFDKLANMAKLYEATLSIRLTDLRELITDMRDTATDRIEGKRTESKERSKTRSKTRQGTDRRAALAAMTDDQLAKLWGFKVGASVDMPVDRDELVDQLLEAMAA